jgi:hypothetical protein
MVPTATLETAKFGAKKFTSKKIIKESDTNYKFR